MSTSWYAIEEAITSSKLNEVNEILATQFVDTEEANPMVLFHDVLDDEYCLRRTVGDKTDHLDIEDYDEKDGSFTRMTRYFQNGDNPDAELILRPLVELGGLTIVSEYDDDSPQGKAQNQLYEDQQKKENNKALA